MLIMQKGTGISKTYIFQMLMHNIYMEIEKAGTGIEVQKKLWVGGWNQGAAMAEQEEDYDIYTYVSALAI